MRERFYCAECGIPMNFHPVTTDYTLPQTELRSEDDHFSGILDEFYSCPACGRTAIPQEELFAEQAMKAYAWDRVFALEMF